jgi:hypothetical protein
MLTPKEIESIPLQIESNMKSLEDAIMLDIVRRIKKTGEITSTADYQIWRLTQLGESSNAIKDKIQKSLKMSNAQIDDIYNKAIETSYTRDKALYEATGTPYTPYKDNIELQQMVKATIAQTKGELINITQTTGFMVEKNGKLVFSSSAEFLQSTLDNAITQITSGTFDYNTVIKRAVATMANSGLRSVDYASGMSSRIEVASRRAIMTGIGQLTGKINEDNARQLDVDTYEVSYHTGARPSHQAWQGKVYSKEQLVSVCGLGSVTGLNGTNCYHDYYPFVPGVSERIYTDEELDAMNKAENTPKTYKGREYTAYEATQRQRALETTMRAQRQHIALLKQGGADEQDIVNAMGRYRSTSAQYADFSKSMGLVQQRERVYIDGLGRV